MTGARIIKAAPEVLKLIRSMVRADRSNAYRNKSDVTFTLKLITPEFVGDFWIFAPDMQRGVTEVILRSYGGPDEEGGKVVCDGATGASNKPKGVLPATGFHDPGYLSINEITEAWKEQPFEPGPNYKRDMVTRLSVKKEYPTWTEADVRQMFDQIFGDAIRDGGGSSLVVRGYFSGVRWLGGMWRALKRVFAGWIVCALVVLLLSGCNGCMSPPDIADFDNFPDMERVDDDN